MTNDNFLTFIDFLMGDEAKHEIKKALCFTFATYLDQEEEQKRYQQGYKAVVGALVSARIQSDGHQFTPDEDEEVLLKHLEAIKENEED